MKYDPVITLGTAYLVPQATREQATQLVLDTCKTLFEDTPADVSAGQAARWLSLHLWGTVRPEDMEAVYEYWLIEKQIQDGADLVYMFDMDNTDANRKRELNTAGGNLMAAVYALLDRAGVTR